ncbi:MAG: zinc ribbon domain-containing protein [Desulfuromonas sp.]|uniref:FmdB family zinc ribbon protein n=1 Tax=Desulfuromonas sp. TaxID=892 RepID=UPI000CB338A7|nr:zinc ribbon domain-containing protein [Desulfuromonas sp.]PLX84726.1 MAG: zinc ribbon domain-containing protein [Desulfuromonas sp.]
MPIYEYRCSDCQQVVEKIERQPSEETPCPACGKTARRSVSVFAASSSGGSGGCTPPPGSGFG